MSNLTDFSVTSLHEAEETLAHFSGISRFPPAIESAYEAHIACNRAVQIFWSGLGAIALLNFFLLTDYNTRPELFTYSLMLRLAVTLPCLGLLWWVYRGVSAQVREIAGFLGFVAADIILSLIFWRTASPVATYDSYVMILVVLFGNVVVPFYFRTCVAFTVVGVLCFVPTFLLHPYVDVNAKLIGLLAYGITALTTLYTNYRLEVANRSSFLVTLRERLRVNEANEINHALRHASNTDVLTQLANRRHFEEVFQQRVRLSTEPVSLAILMIDVDYFKQYNDKWGHLQGDVCLRQVAQVVKSHSRGDRDLAARMGGEEFAVLLLGAQLQDAWRAAERMRWAIEQMELDSPTDGGGTHRITVSIGIALALSTQLDLVDNMLARADAALYMAKRAGRNNVQVDPKSVQALRDST